MNILTIFTSNRNDVMRLSVKVKSFTSIPPIHFNSW